MQVLLHVACLLFSVLSFLGQVQPSHHNPVAVVFFFVGCLYMLIHATVQSFHLHLRTMILAVAATFGPRLNRTSASLNLNKLGCTTHSPIVLLLILPLTLSFFASCCIGLYRELSNLLNTCAIKLQTMTDHSAYRPLVTY